jgi:hypothetical protein
MLSSAGGEERFKPSKWPGVVPNHKVPLASLTPDVDGSCASTPLLAQLRRGAMDRQRSPAFVNHRRPIFFNRRFNQLKK